VDPGRPDDHPGIAAMSLDVACHSFSSMISIVCLPPEVIRTVFFQGLSPVAFA